MKCAFRLTTLATILLVHAAAAAQVPIRVEERADLARQGEPVTLGVPLGRGIFAPATPVRLVGPSGAPVVAQFRPMARWDDGSIKWLKCDFAADVDAGGTAPYTLEQGTPGPMASALAVDETATAITVTTGPLRFVVRKDAFTLIDRAWLDLDGDDAYEAEEEIVTPDPGTGAEVRAGGVSYTSAARARLYGADGVPLGEPFLVPDRDVASAAPDVATDGTAFYLTWIDGRSGVPAIYATKTAGSSRATAAAHPDLPAALALEVPYPNPFTGAATLTYHVAEAGPVSLVVRDALGRTVARLVEGWQAPGTYSVSLPEDAVLAAGSYIAVLAASGAVRSRTLIHLGE